MSNTKSMFWAVTTFQEKQLNAYNEYMDRLKQLENVKDSQYYIDEKKKASEKRRSAEEAARKEARQWLNKLYNYMCDANSKRSVEAPTDEQMRILQAVKMRDSVSVGELEQAANAMEGNGLGLGVLMEYAKSKYKPGEYPNLMRLATGNYPIDEMQGKIDEAMRQCNKILNSSGAKRGAELALRTHDSRYGGNFNFDALKREPIAKSEKEFFDNMLDCGFEVFSNCVND